jgi:hypothetical protein
MMVVSLSKLNSVVNPAKSPPWKEWTWGEITKEDVLAACKKGLPKQYHAYDPLKPESKQDHINRVAWFYQNGWEDTPILLTFVKGLYPIYDGTHRTIAAMLHQHDFIIANVEGSMEKIKSVAY